MIHTIAIFSGILSFIFALLLIEFSRRNHARKPVIFLFTVMAAGLALYLAISAWPSERLVSLYAALVFIYGPANWRLVRSRLTGTNELLSVWHLVPFMVASCVAIFVPGSITVPLMAMGSLHFLIYVLFALRDMFANWGLLNDREQLGWLGALLFLALWASAIRLVASPFLLADPTWQAPAPVRIVDSLLPGLVTLIVLWWALIKPEVYRDPESGSKVQRPRPNQAEMELVQRLREALSSGNVITDSGATLASVAASLGATPRELSEAINRVTGKGFRAFLRTYRIRHAMQMLRDPEYSDMSILEIALDSGFGTKSVFNEAFRSETGKTPTQYRNPGDTNTE